MAEPIPDDALDDRLGFVGTAGGGKTYNAGGRVERLLQRKARCIIIDPLDVWWGLRLLADGKTASPFNIVILGGQRADLPLNEFAGALIGETVAKAAESFIVSLGTLGTKAAERRFMLAFLTALYRHVDGEPVHLIFDEADLWAPQRLLDKEGEAAKLLGQMETIVRRGRIKGFIPWLITQRPAVLSKDVLSQVDGLVAFKLTSSQDRDAIGDWVQGQADKAQWNAIWASLPTLPRGSGVVWIPGRGILDTVVFPAKATFDSSATPKRGEKKRGTATLLPLNVDALKSKLESVAKETVENDPRRLKARIAELERASKVAVAAPSQSAIQDAERRGYERGRSEGHLAGMAEVVKLIRPAIDKGNALIAAGVEMAEALKSIAPALAAPPSQAIRIELPEPISIRDRSGTVMAPRNHARNFAAGNTERVLRPGVVSNDGSPLPKGERSCLAAAAQHRDGVTRQQLTILTGYKRSTRDAYVQRLRDRGYLAQADGRLVSTPEGDAALGQDFERLPTGDALRAHWLANLPDGERRVLEAAIAHYPDTTTKAEIDAATSFKRSTRDAYIQRLRARALIEASRDGVRVVDALFGQPQAGA